MKHSPGCAFSRRELVSNGPREIFDWHGAIAGGAGQHLKRHNCVDAGQNCRPFNRKGSVDDKQRAAGGTFKGSDGTGAKGARTIPGYARIYCCRATLSKVCEYPAEMSAIVVCGIRHRKTAVHGRRGGARVGPAPDDHQFAGAAGGYRPRLERCYASSLVVVGLVYRENGRPAERDNLKS